MLYGPKLLVDGKNHNVMSNYNVSQTSYQTLQRTKMNFEKPDQANFNQKVFKN